MLSIPSSEKQLSNYTFIDLFARIGGFHYAFESFGATCVFASEIDKKAAHTYTANHGITPAGDITKIAAPDIPQHDILCGGFPCQAFSVSGKQKGFEDTRGTLLFDIARIVDFHRPKVLLLENVKNFVRHDEGKTLQTVLKTLENLGYKVHYQILNTSKFGLPQNRERVYIVGFDQKQVSNPTFSFPTTSVPSSLQDLLEKAPKEAKIIERSDVFYHKNYEPKQDLFGNIVIPNRPIQLGKINKGGQGERIYHPAGHAITLSAYGGGVGSKTGIYKVNGILRKLSPRECARVQGFPESFILPERKTEAYKQFGNSVSINTLQYIIKEIIKTIG